MTGSWIGGKNNVANGSKWYELLAVDWDMFY